MNPSPHETMSRVPARTVERDTYTHIGHKLWNGYS